MSPTWGRSAVIAAFANRPTGLSGTPKPPISPLVGEMSGRTEGGAKDRDARRTVHPKPPSSTRP
ncbi:hypothetical protein FJ957_28655 [Mesorhizobium sp. B2-4-6]|nr:hypothetical protein FJ957_28655 [Mesorhizobium sp. B2-4-6]